MCLRYTKCRYLLSVYGLPLGPDASVLRALAAFKARRSAEIMQQHHVIHLVTHAGLRSGGQQREKVGGTGGLQAEQLTSHMSHGSAHQSSKNTMTTIATIPTASQ